MKVREFHGLGTVSQLHIKDQAVVEAALASAAAPVRVCLLRLAAFRPALDE